MNLQTSTRGSTAGLFLLPAVFGDVHDFVLKDKKVGCAFARQTNHVLVVILNPSPDCLSIHQLNADRFLFLAQSLEEGGFFEGLFRGRGPAALGGVGISLRAERHNRIVHKGASALVGFSSRKPAAITMDERSSVVLEADSQSEFKLARSAQGKRSGLKAGSEGRKARPRSHPSHHIRRQNSILAGQQRCSRQVPRQECVPEVEDIKHARAWL